MIAEKNKQMKSAEIHFLSYIKKERNRFEANNDFFFKTERIDRPTLKWTELNSHREEDSWIKYDTVCVIRLVSWKMFT